MDELLAQVGVAAEIEKDLALTLEKLNEESASTSAIRAGLVKLPELMASIDRELRRMRAAELLFEPDNLAWLADWARRMERRHIGVRLLPTRLVTEDEWGEVTSECLGVPEGYRIPGKHLVAALREAIVLPKKARAA